MAKNILLYIHFIDTCEVFYKTVTLCDCWILNKPDYVTILNSYIII